MTFNQRITYKLCQHFTSILSDCVEERRNTYREIKKQALISTPPRSYFFFFSKWALQYFIFLISIILFWWNYWCPVAWDLFYFIFKPNRIYNAQYLNHFPPDQRWCIVPLLQEEISSCRSACMNHILLTQRITNHFQTDPGEKMCETGCHNKDRFVLAW